MDKILLHIAGIAILEIIFYFTYIGPMETQLFKETFKNSLKSLYVDNHSSNTHPMNFSNLFIYYDNNSNYNNELKDNSYLDEEERVTYNNKLFYQMSIYWVIFFIITILIYIITYIYQNKYKSNTTEMNQEMITYDIEINSMEDNSFEDNTNLINKIKNNNNYKYLYKVIYYIIFGGLILLFEYIFFQYIVTKYHVISQGEIKYIIYSQLYDSVKNEIKRYF